MSSARTAPYRTSSFRETQTLAADIARAIMRGKRGRAATVIALRGDLGAGKTTFVQGFLKGMGSKRRATSPTFILMRRYRLAARHGSNARNKTRTFLNIFHIDAYRLKNPEHVSALELHDVMRDPQNIVLIEWPERAKGLLPKNAIRITFRHGKKEHERVITIAGVPRLNAPKKLRSVTS